jgi:hypothetical protein
MRRGHMPPVIRVDEEVMSALQRRATEIGLVFPTPNQALRGILGLPDDSGGKTPQVIHLAGAEGDRAIANPPMITTDAAASRIPSSHEPKVQRLIAQLLPALLGILESSGNVLTRHPITQKWVANPNNFVALKVQDARALNLCLYIYGRPGDFGQLPARLNIKPERAKYSRFNVDSPDQIQDALDMVRRAYDLKQRLGK